MNGFLVIAGILIFVVGMYILTYYLNQNVDAPEGVEEVTSCGTCNSTSCSLRKKGGPSNHIEEETCEVNQLG